MTPSQTVYMSEEGPVDVVESLRSATRYEFLTLPSQPSASTARTGSQLRAMQTLSYFHSTEIPGTASPPIPSWDARPISAVPPWEVHYASEKKGIKGILSYDYQSPPELFRAAIDGMVLAVVEVEDEKAFREITAGYDTTLQQPAASVQNSANETETQGICPEQGKCTDKLKIIESPEGLPMISNTNDATLDPNYSRVMGLALVRGVDTINKKLQLISPLTESQIQSARSQGHDIILLHGKFDAPTWAYAEDFFHQRATASLEEQAEQRDVDVTYEGAGEESHGAVQEDYVEDVPQDAPAVPWLEILQGHQKRPVGSGVWRVRRDLGRSTGD
ncbi:RNA processing protein Grc3 [Cordyceps fumosorosea ARSEF 2679]|uniref:RNA processing protein Grc3 n=1 Tax=Cordyceps fumosorosea (strain ARSEF 2679) TaxID=1081104 RepID=A0A168EBD1_CORFA|nr:RNA processing protein Grc3 [Cordyceps fumosorosea ARSEF 2679]OAA73607.1 RNA processing protein Grc3 [Cordyceps fumosorosea ARSEF 2679]